MVDIRASLRRLFTRGLVVAFSRASISFAGCNADFDNKGASKYKGKVCLLGNPGALPGGSPDHPLFRDAQRWKCVTFGPRFGASVDTKGRVYIWGKGKDDTFVLPFQIPCNAIVDCHCSSKDLYLLGADSQVYILHNVERYLHDRSPRSTSNDTIVGSASSDINKNPSTKLHNEESNVYLGLMPGLGNKKVVKMSVGNRHAAFLTDDGELYCTGDNTFGQCGTKPNTLKSNTIMTFDRGGNDMTEHIKLHKVEFNNAATNVVDVVCGGRHTCCIDSEGNIYTFGDDSSVQLFLGDTRGRTILEQDRYKPYIKHDDYGASNYAKYSHTDRHLQYNPIPVNAVGRLSEHHKLLEGATLSLAAGDDFTIVAVTTTTQRERKTHIIASGDNRLGQCGRLDVRMNLPKSIHLPGSIIRGTIGCGSSHCIAAMEGGYLIGWGSNQQKQLDPAKRGNLTVPTNINHCITSNTVENLNRHCNIEFIRCAFNNTAIIFK